MANLQVKDIDDNLYQALKKHAKKQRRSISQEVIMIIETYLSQQESFSGRLTEQFIQLQWEGSPNESAENLVNNIQSDRKKSKRFSENNDVFD